MAVLTAARSIYRKGAEDTGSIPIITVQMKANAVWFQGGLIGVDATGYGVSGAALQATGIKIVGIALKSGNNTGGASGAVSVDCQRGVFPFANLGGDPVTIASMFATVFCEDDQTVRVSNGGATRSNLGLFVGFGDNGEPLVEVGIRSATGV